jgi:hypothetical protein
MRVFTMFIKTPLREKLKLLTELLKAYLQKIKLSVEKVEIMCEEISEVPDRSKRVTENNIYI